MGAAPIQGAGIREKSPQKTLLKVPGISGAYGALTGLISGLSGYRVLFVPFSLVKTADEDQHGRHDHNRPYQRTTHGKDRYKAKVTDHVET